jgi:hypothetical protein
MTTLETAWADAVAALGPNQRLVLWQDKDGPQWVQVLAPEPPACEHEDEQMRPAVSRLAAYPSKGLGDLVAELIDLTATLRGKTDD